MGVIRYFPGSEPDGRAGEPTAEPSALEESALQAADSEPGWAVPGITPGRGVAAFEPTVSNSAAAGSISSGSTSTRAVTSTTGVGESSEVERRRPDVSAKAERISLGALSRHDVSEAEMLDKLVSRGFDAGEAADEVERLTRVGLLDDAALAERLVTSLRERKGLGDSAIGPALRLRRLPTAVIDAALADSDEEASLDRLEALARERARRLGSLAPAVAERRLMAYLMRKGYSGSSVRDAVRRALASQPLR